MGRTDSVRDHSEILLVFFDAKTESLRGYDVSTKNWNEMQSYAAEMKKWNFTALVLNEYIYVLLANKAVYSLKYAIHDSCWTRMPDMTSDHGQYPPATVFEGSIHVHGTAGAGFPSASGERFDPAQNQWQIIADMKTERKSHAIASTSDAVYCIGGQNTEGEIGSVERFSLNTDTWTYCAPMSRPRHSAAAVELGNKIYVICGWTSHNRLCDVEIYDPASDAWSAVQATNVPRALPKACVVGGQLMVVGGDESRTETMENYSPHQKSWTIKALPDMRIDSAVSIP